MKDPKHDNNAKRKEAIAWLEGIANHLDAHLLDELPLEEVQRRLHDQGLDAGPLVESVERQLRQASGFSPDRDRRPLRHLTRRRFFLAASVILFIASGLLILVLFDVFSAPPASLATLTPYQQERLSTIIRRSQTATPDHADEINKLQAHLERGVDHFQKAPRKTLGLFQRYDQESVDAALEELYAAYELSQQLAQTRNLPEEADDPASIAFLIARTHLMNNDASGAMNWFYIVLESEDDSLKTEAENLLWQLD